MISISRNVYIDKLDGSHYLIVALEKNVIIFRANISVTVHIDNNGKDILVLGGRPTQDSK